MLSRYIAALLLIVLCAVGFYAYTQSVQVDKLTKDLTQAVEQRDEALRSLQRASESVAVTEEVVTKNSEVKLENVSKAKEIKAKVQKAETNKVNETITNSEYDAALVSSMWDSYCYSVPDDPACTSRQPPD